MAAVEFPDGSQPYFASTAYHLQNKNDRKIAKKAKLPVFTEALRDAEAAADFSDATAEGYQADASVEAMLDSVHEQGDVLKTEPTLANVRKYKEAVRAFMKYVVDNSLCIEERTSGTNILKRKKFTLLTIIDQKLESLAAGVLRNQKDQLELLRRVDEINGLLVDLLQ
jgi:uncharacterized protein